MKTKIPTRAEWRQQLCDAINSPEYQDQIKMNNTLSKIQARLESLDLSNEAIGELESILERIEDKTATWDPQTGILTCPHCNFEGLRGHESQEGEYGSGFRYTEDVRMHREIYRAIEDQSALAVSTDEHPMLEDCGSFRRLECRNCLAESRIPPELSYDFGDFD